MAGLASDGTNPDVSLLYDINGLAKAAPGWFDRVMGFVGEYGIMLGLVLVAVWCWWRGRSSGTAEDSVTAAAGIVWAPLAAALAVLVNVPIRGFVERPRPFRDHEGLEVLVQGKTDYSFVSDHATLAMAIAVGLFIVNKRFGAAAIGLALAEGFCRVYMGVHYPTDVIGGFALGTAVALLLAPVALALLTPFASAVARSPRAGVLVRSRKAPGGGGRHETVALADPRGEAGGGGERDLAA
ncbi:MULTISPECIES: phosphatase PAP2 family protein [Streptomyces]|jgi:Membrane-associated phospholipid phosphatase|uniref:Undecaprenyl-diphosphatase BcrC n=2 Tax=Streptomyces TaxID=1883 RepID=A0A1D8G2P8_9ACTN|nr:MULTISPECIES: phosphatase PAP2 family protein [Streptomyces]AOT59713.1 Undecaprenyl-diphosphatase BcrC [Streptomyces rubrolavendulae]KAF0650583.1 membrane protein [Streptomyces fradiae ATCC 10745 = DSM 40063]OSY50004.1 Undecaprenyl-diphosphatase BcrC [Streptomyces fradiae ATCC 10745 = DSM 40063]QEV12919.1 phosphatase PAP2 family protein [Streptomyces fradiae ATCC 10745 = DSM 40063]UQS31818.1 phosphatase PAP2 family protein [Streptomyces fradiae]